MIPKIAFFYWTGGPLPWIREQALVTFQKHHPGWKVVLGSPQDREVPAGVDLWRDNYTDPFLPPAARSDVWRWAMLADMGGLYADTDVIFLRNVEPLFTGSYDAWITQDLGTPVPQLGRRRNLSHGMPRVALSIGVLAARKGSGFFSRLAFISRNTPPSDDYQSHGTSLMVTHWSSLVTSWPVGRIPRGAFYREGSSKDQVRLLWTEQGEFSEGEYGLHWYGGSPESQPHLGVKSIQELPVCWVRRALEACGARHKE